MDKKKKITFFSLLGVDIVLTIVLFVIAIILIATLPAKGEKPDTSTFIGYMQANPGMILGLIAVPLIILFVVNIIGIVWYFKKANAKKQINLSDLTPEQKEAIKQSLLKDVEDKKEE